MQDFIFTLLLGLSSLFGVNQVQSDLNWKILKKWESVNSKWVFEAKSTTIISQCQAGQFLSFPQIIHGIHNVWIDGKLIIQTGDPSFKKASSFYERPSIDCKFLKNSSEIRWEVISYSYFFSKLQEFPALVSAKQIVINNIFDVSLNFASAMSLIVFTLLSIFLFAGKISKDYLAILIIGGLSFTTYSVVVIADKVGLDISMLAAHKIADIALWIGATSYFYFFMIRRIIGVGLFRVYLAFLSIALLILTFGSNPDEVQFGTLFPMPVATAIFCIFLINLVRKYDWSQIKETGIEFISALMFVVVCINDLLNIFGIIRGYMVLPLVSLLVFFHLAAIVNSNIRESFRQKEKLMADLKSQHMLEQVAHDIRSPLSVLNLLVPSFTKEPDHEKASLLIQASQRIEGIAGELLNKSSSYSTARVFDLIRFVENVIHEKQIEYGSQNDVKIYFSNLVSGTALVKLQESEVARMLSNLINNSVDAMNGIDNPKIKIEIACIDSKITLSIVDNGKGMSPEILSKIGQRGITFGKKIDSSGSGLGLFHAKTFLESNNGKLEITTLFVGTCVKIMFNKYNG